MSVTYKAALASPLSVKVTVQITTTAENWKTVVKQISDMYANPPVPYELSQVLNAMREAVYKSESFVGGTIEDAKEKN